MGEDARAEAPGGLPLCFRRAARSPQRRRGPGPAPPAARRLKDMLQPALEACARALQRLLRGAGGSSVARLRAPGTAPAARGKAAALRARCSRLAAAPWLVLLLVLVVGWQPRMGKAAFVWAALRRLGASAGQWTLPLCSARACYAYSHMRMIVCRTWLCVLRVHLPRTCLSTVRDVLAWDKCASRADRATMPTTTCLGLPPAARDAPYHYYVIDTLVSAARRQGACRA